MNWNEIDWPVLDRLRARFLSSPADPEPYWGNRTDLSNYDFTYGERIGWKWDQVLRELHMRRWTPRCRTILDWGCGSGIAGRRVIGFFGAGAFDRLTVWDQSPIACDFAAERAQAAFSGLGVVQATPGFVAGNEPVGLLVVSHVLNELAPDALDALLKLANRAESLLWVEPGTREISRRLGAIREPLRHRGFWVVAPCTHQDECPMSAIGRESDWCHFFAPPPPEIFADSSWVKFGRRAGIDLRSLPYSFIALDRSPAPDPRSVPPSSRHSAPLSRVIGRVERFKPYARLHNCDSTGLAELELPKRADPALWKELERTRAPLLYRWRRDGNRILGGEPAVPPAASSRTGPADAGC